MGGPPLLYLGHGACQGCFRSVMQLRGDLRVWGLRRKWRVALIQAAIGAAPGMLDRPYPQRTHRTCRTDLGPQISH